MTPRRMSPILLPAGASAPGDQPLLATFEPVLRPKLILPSAGKDFIEIPRSIFKRFEKTRAGNERWKRFQDRIMAMAGSKSNNLSQKQIQEIAGGIAYSAPGTEYYALWTSALSDTSTGSTAGEASYTSYVRVSVTNDQTTGWNAATGTTTSTVTNKSAVNWPANTGSSQTMTYLMIADAATTGNSCFWTDITSVTINGGDTPQLAAAALSLVDD